MLFFIDANGDHNGSFLVKPYPKSSEIETTAYLENLPDNALSNVRCVLYLGCETAMTDQYDSNILRFTYDKGAHFVLGLHDITYVNKNNYFLNGFLNAVNSGKSIEEAITSGILNAEDVYLKTYGCYDEQPVCYIGDVNQTLN